MKYFIGYLAVAALIFSSGGGEVILPMRQRKMQQMRSKQKIRSNF